MALPCMMHIITGNTTNDSFNKSKKLLEKVIYMEPEHRMDIYCNCQYDEKNDVDFKQEREAFPGMGQG